MSRWKRVTKGDRLRLLLVAMALLAGAYGGLIYPVTQKGLSDAEQLVHRRMDRMKKRTKVTAQTQESPQTYAKKLTEAESALSLLQTQWDGARVGFVALEDRDAQQRLLLDISTLAEGSGIQVLKSGALFSATPENANGQGPRVDIRLGRPLLQISARSNYWQLLAFLDGLPDLNHQVSVVQLAMTVRSEEKAKEEKGSDGSPISADSLDLIMILAI